jgi:hypothetical protein
MPGKVHLGGANLLGRAECNVCEAWGIIESRVAFLLHVRRCNSHEDNYLHFDDRRLEWPDQNANPGSACEVETLPTVDCEK